MTRLSLGVLLLTASLASAAPSDYSFTRLEGMNDAFALSISGDGSVVFGRTATNLMRWTDATGTVDLGPCPDFWVTATSYDGSSVVGIDQSHNAFKWTQATGFVPLVGNVADTSSDGSVLVGNVAGNPFRWTDATGQQFLPLLPGDRLYAAAADTVAGRGNDGVFIWSPATGRQSLGELYRPPEGTNLFAFPTALSTDGSRVVGSTGNEPEYAWQGTVTSGPEPISLAPPGFMSISDSYAVSADGSFAVGDHFTEAWVWVQSNKTFDLATLLTSNGVPGIPDPSIGTLTVGRHSLSDDGRTIVGRGFEIGQPGYAWVATIEDLRTVPEPSSLILAGLAIVGALAVCLSSSKARWTEARPGAT